MPEDPDCNWLDFGQVHIPPRKPADARAAILGLDGGESYLDAQDQSVLLLNNMDLAHLTTATAMAEASRLERELLAINRKLSWTTPTILRPAQGVRVNWSTRGLVMALSGAAGLGLLVSVVVLSDYALRSTSDLFANDPFGAALFATLPSLGAIALKCFESRLGTDARWLYGTALFALGMVSLAIWIGCAAVTFAPSTGGLATLLLQGPGSGGVTTLLVLTTIVCDATLGYTIIAGIGQLLSPSEMGESGVNPQHARLTEEKSRLELAIAECQRRRGQAQNYLARVAAARALTRRQAEHDLNRARELWTQAQTAALAFAVAMFLKTEEDTP